MKPRLGILCMCECALECSMYCQQVPGKSYPELFKSQDQRPNIHTESSNGAHVCDNHTLYCMEQYLKYGSWWSVKIV